MRLPWIDIGSLSLKSSALKATTDSPGIAFNCSRGRCVAASRTGHGRPERGTRGREERTLLSLAQLAQNRGPFLDFTEIGASRIKDLRYASSRFGLVVK